MPRKPEIPANIAKAPEAAKLRNSLIDLLALIDREPELFAGYYRQARAGLSNSMTKTEFLRYARALVEALTDATEA